jgi:hypothetical protein
MSLRMIRIINLPQKTKAVCVFYILGCDLIILVMLKFEEKEEEDPELSEDNEEEEEGIYFTKTFVKNVDPADEDEFGEADNPEWEKKFLQLLPLISKKDPILYKQNAFFPEREKPSDKNAPKTEATKPLRMKEYLTNNMMETEGKEVDERQEIRKLQSITFRQILFNI